MYPYSREDLRITFDTKVRNFQSAVRMAADENDEPYKVTIIFYHL